MWLIQSLELGSFLPLPQVPGWQMCASRLGLQYGNLPRLLCSSQLGWNPGAQAQGPGHHPTLF